MVYLTANLTSAKIEAESILDTMHTQVERKSDQWHKSIEGRAFGGKMDLIEEAISFLGYSIDNLKEANEG